MQYGLIGEHLSHSYSREIHEQIAGYSYELKELAPSELPAFLHKKEFRAINVTIPYKQAVIPFLDEIEEQAEQIGAVNTIVNRDGRLKGFNTDFSGMRALIQKLGLKLQGKKVLILGTGGTSKTAHAVCKSLNAGEILHVSRSGNARGSSPEPGSPQPSESGVSGSLLSPAGDAPKGTAGEIQPADGRAAAGREGSWKIVSYTEAESLHTDAQIIINTTPCGMFPKTGETPIRLSAFLNLEGVVDAVYNPLRSNFVLDAQERGLPGEGGLYMLAAQAVFACGFFLDREMSEEDIRRAFWNVLRQKRNIVLCGMPSCGKTTVSAKLGEDLGMKVVDTDSEIVKRAGMEIAEFSRKNGERAFRDLESEVVREVSGRTGIIIATGGGAVLRKENVRALKRNGILVFIDRPLSLLTATPDRPFSSNPKALRQRFEERYDIYCNVCDLRVDGARTVEEVAGEILAQAAQDSGSGA